VVGPCNRFAHAACVGVSEQPGKTYNPLFIHGNSGLGKTHLMQSLCHSVLERAPKTRILYLSCETFVNHFISALEHGNLTKFRDKYRNVGVLVVDDIHLLANKEKTQEEFFHTFNTLYNAARSSCCPPTARRSRSRPCRSAWCRASRGAS
jgi:chromosomal replication initiator protein